MSYDTSSDTKVVNLNPVGYSPDAGSMASPVASMPSAVMEGGKPSRRSSSGSSSGSSSSGSRRRSHRKSRDRETSSSEDDYEEEDYSDREEDGKKITADKVVVRKDGSVRSGSSKSSKSSDSSGASSYSEEESDEEEDAISMTSTEILENDPLFFVLSRIFVTHDKKKNIADLLQEVVDLLKEQRDHRMQRMQGGHSGSHMSSVPMQR